MTRMKQFGLAAVLVIGVALFAGTSATAMAADTIPLKPSGADPNASGFVQTRLQRHFFEAKVVCKGLTPGAAYFAYATWYDDRTHQWWSALLGDFVANRNGAGQIGWERYYPTGNVVFVVLRDDGPNGYTMVLIAP